jgi:hypothetical protein
MITDFDKLTNVSGSTHFQSVILKNIEELLDQIYLTVLSTYSYIEIKKNVIIVSFVHKQDSDTIVTLNILESHATLWYSACNIYFDKDLDINYFKQIYKNCLLGNYETTDFYLKKKIIFSSTTLLNNNIEKCIIPRTFFYKVYIWLYKKNFTLKKIKYKSFLR